MEELPIVPFGKHKGEPITTLINDTAYLEWCKQRRSQYINNTTSIRDTTSQYSIRRRYINNIKK